MSSLCILSTGAYIWRVGHILSMHRFREALDCAIAVIPPAGVDDPRDCIEEITDNVKELTAARGSWGCIYDDPPNDHSQAMRVIRDLVIITDLSFHGNSSDPTYSCGIDYEMSHLGWDEVGEACGDGQSRILANLAREKMGDEHDGCHFLTLWWYDSGKTPDTWLGPGEYWSEWGIIGEITDEHLETLAAATKEVTG